MRRQCGSHPPVVLRLHCLLGVQGSADLESPPVQVHIGVVCFGQLSEQGFGFVGCVAARHSGFPGSQIENHTMRHNCTGCVLVANPVSYFAPEMLSSVLVGIFNTLKRPKLRPKLWRAWYLRLLGQLVGWMVRLWLWVLWCLWRVVIMWL